MTTTPSDLAEVAVPRRKSRAAHPALYCILLVAIPLAAIVASLAIIRSSWFAPRSGNLYLATIGYGATLHNRSCDVVISGDSSGLVDVLPSVIRKESGLSACDIAEFGGMEQVNGTVVLDTYLKNNPPPKYLVFVYVPENISPHKTWTSVAHFEAIYYGIRSNPSSKLLVNLLEHPKVSLEFVTMAVRLAVQAFTVRPLSDDAMQIRARNDGWIEERGTALTTCLPVHSINPPDAKWARDLRAKYSSPATQVLLDVPPQPECDPDYDYYSSSLRGIIDNEPERYAINLYSNNGRLHMFPAGAERFTREILQQIQLRQDAAGKFNR